MTIKIVKTGSKLKAWRMKHGVSQQDFARQIGTRSQRLCDWESGRKTPNLEFMRRIYVATNGAVTPGDFFGIVGMHASDEQALLESAEE